MKLRFIGHPRYEYAHPDEANEEWAGTICTKCAIAEDPETGRRFMLWSHGPHWSLNRNDPAFGTDVRLEDIELIK